MRKATLVQEMQMDVASHWRLFLDDDFERDLYLVALRCPAFEQLESRQTETEVVRRVRVVPLLDVPGPVRAAIGTKFAYTEDGRFDKKEQVWRATITPSVLTDRLSATLSVRAAETEPGRCRRTVDFEIAARVFGIGGMIESAFEKSMRDGWVTSARYMNERASR